MKNIDYFFDLLKQSDVSLLGYTFAQEKIKDEIISKLPHLEIDSSFSRSNIRDIKIEHVLNNVEISKNISSKLLLMDLNNIPFNGGSKISVDFDRQKKIRDIVNNLRCEIWKSEFKLLLLSSMYTNPNGEQYNSLSFLGGISPVAESDICCVLGEDNIKVLKNRYGSNDIKISLDGLKDYNYICDYENN